MKTIDNILIFCLIIAIFIGSAFIFVGNDEDFNRLKATLVKSILLRTLSFGLSGSVALFLIRFFLFQLIGEQSNNPGIRTLILSSLTICLLSALLGSLYFFHYGNI